MSFGCINHLVLCDTVALLMLPSKILLVFNGFNFLYHFKQEKRASMEEYKKPSFIIQTPFISFMATLFFSSAILLPMTQFMLAFHCPTKCGSVDIRYPFGIGKGCFFRGFEVTCNQSIPYLSTPNLQLLEILPGGEVRVNSNNFIAKTCFQETNEKIGRALIQFPEESPYTISITKNILVGIGCGMEGSVSGDYNSWDSCFTDCSTNESMVNGSCHGKGCCQMHLPPERKKLFIEVHQLHPSTTNCSYGFVVEKGTYIFTESDLFEFNTSADISMRLEWSLESEYWSCSAADKLMCGVNTHCSASMSGVSCICMQGYEGNPYAHYSFEECEG